MVSDTPEEIYRRKYKAKAKIREKRRTAKRFTIFILILAFITIIVGMIKLLK